MAKKERLPIKYFTKNVAMTMRSETTLMIRKMLNKQNTESITVNCLYTSSLSKNVFPSI